LGDRFFLWEVDWRLCEADSSSGRHIRRADSASRRHICGSGRQILLPGNRLKAPGGRFCLWESDSRAHLWLREADSASGKQIEGSGRQILPLGV